MDKFWSCLPDLLRFRSEVTYAENSHKHSMHIHETLVDGEKLEVDPEQFDNFVEGLPQSQIAIVSVKGMVCDFCTRIEKTFRKDNTIRKSMSISAR